MKKKILSSLFATLMIAILVTGCGKEETVSDSEVSNTKVEIQKEENPVLESVEEIYPDDMVIEFKDEKFLTYIRESLNKMEGNITYGDIKGCQALVLDKEGYTDLSPLEYFTNLESLTIWGNGVVNDLSFLQNCHQLKDLILWECNSVNDINGLSYLDNLETLTMHFDVYDISALSSLVNLKSLTITSSGLEDITPISNLVNLESLKIDANNPYSNTSWSGLTKLTTVEAYCEDIDFLEGATNIKELILTGVNLDDISVVGTLVNLEKLTLENCIYLQDISALSELSNLKELSITGLSSIENISVIGTLSNLKELKISCEKINNGKEVSLENLSEVINQ